MGAAWFRRHKPPKTRPDPLRERVEQVSAVVEHDEHERDADGGVHAREKAAEPRAAHHVACVFKVVQGVRWVHTVADGREYRGRVEDARPIVLPRIVGGILGRGSARVSVENGLNLRVQVFLIRLQSDKVRRHLRKQVTDHLRRLKQMR